MKPQVYKINKGKHYANPKRPILCLKKKIPFIFTIPKKSAYSFINEDSNDINKIFGISAGFNHHQDSIRLGWVPNFKNPDRYSLYSIIYRGGIRHLTFLGDIFYGLRNYCVINIKDNSITLQHPFGVIELQISKGPHFYLRPYFGGDNVAPHDIEVIIEL